MFNIVQMVMTFVQNRFANSERGEVSIEYVLVGGLAAAAIVLGMATFAPAVSTWFVNIAGDVSGALPI